MWLCIKSEVNEKMNLLDQSHSSVERAGLLAGVRVRLLPTDEQFQLRGSVLQAAIDEDKAKGNIPCYVIIFLCGCHHVVWFDYHWMNAGGGNVRDDSIVCFRRLGRIGQRLSIAKYLAARGCRLCGLCVYMPGIPTPFARRPPGQLVQLQSAQMAAGQFRLFSHVVKHRNLFIRVTTKLKRKFLLNQRQSFMCRIHLCVFTSNLSNDFPNFVRLKNANDLVDAFNVDPLYLKHDKQGMAPDYRVSTHKARSLLEWPICIRSHSWW